MYYIYLDEAYNLTPGAKNQFIILGGFGTSEPKRVANAHKKIRKLVLKQKQLGTEIKSFDRLAVEKLIPKIFKTLKDIDVVIYIIYQDKKVIPRQYYYKEKLNYERLYLEMLTILLRDEWKLKGQKQITVTADTFKTKMDKEKIIEKVLLSLKEQYPEKHFGLQFSDSTSDLNLQVADFIVGRFFRGIKQGYTPAKLAPQGVYARIIINILK